MARFERGDDAFGAAQVVEGFERFLVRDAHVFSAADVLQEGMLGADAGVVQACAHAVGLGDLAVVVLQDVSAVAVQHAGAAQLQRARVLARIHAFARGFHTDQTGVFVRDVGVEDAHGVAAATHAGNHRVGLLLSHLQAFEHLGHLREAFFANHALEVAHHHGVGVRARHGADDVEGVVHIGDPVAHGFVERVLEGFAARLDRDHGRAQQFHAVDVGALALDVFAAHVDHALQAVAGANGGGGHAMLACAGLGNDARLAHALGEHGLADGVVDLVGARVVQVFALEEDLRAAHFAAHAGCVVDGRRTPHKVRQLGLEFGDEFRVVLVLGVGVFEFVDGMRQRFADEAAAVNAKVALDVGLLVVVHGVSCRNSIRGKIQRGSASAARTAAANCWIFWASFRPLPSSMPELTSTASDRPHERSARMPSATFAGVSPPDKTR